jgi:HlyD family secretion protein
MVTGISRRIWIVAAVVIVSGITWLVLASGKPVGPGEGFISGNGRIEATEIDIATTLPGRVIEISVNEGDFVDAGQPLAQMQIDSLDAQKDEAQAHYRQTLAAAASAEAQVAVRRSDTIAASAVAGQRESELDTFRRRLARSELLSEKNALSGQELDDDRAGVRTSERALAASRAQIEAANAAVDAAVAQVAGARSGVAAAEATMARIESDLRDCQLKSPLAGRIQYRIAQPGEVLSSGGKVLNLVDLSDVYMTFFLPENVAGRVPLGSDVRIILDAAPQYVIPAKVSYVASTAQFTPKTVETASERQKLMFRIKAQISHELLLQHLRVVKTGLPGVAWLKLNPEAEWPEKLQIRVPES